MRVRSLLLAVGFVPAALALGGCVGESTASDPRNPTAAADDARVSRGEFRKTFLLTGELEAVTGYPILVPRLETWRVPIRWILDDGSPVAEGDRVVELDTTQVIGDVAQKRIAADTALNELYQKKADLAVKTADKEFAVETARVTHEKASLKAAVPADLVDRRGYQEAQLEEARSQAALENAMADLEAFREASQRELEILRINLEKTRREIARAERALETMTLRAPHSGILVVSENRQEGRKLQVNDQVRVGLKVAEVPDLSSMIVRAKLSDVDDGKIARGMRVTCTVDAYPDRRIAGTITEIGPVAQEERGATMRRHFNVVVSLDSSDPTIMRPGMSVLVEVETARLADVLLVPRTAISLSSTGTLAHLHAGSDRNVELGECNATTCVLLDGLDEGTRLRAPG